MKNKKVRNCAALAPQQPRSPNLINWGHHNHRVGRHIIVPATPPLGIAAYCKPHVCPGPDGARKLWLWAEAYLYQTDKLRSEYVVSDDVRSSLSNIIGPGGGTLMHGPNHQYNRHSHI